MHVGGHDGVHAGRALGVHDVKRIVDGLGLGKLEPRTALDHAHARAGDLELHGIDSTDLGLEGAVDVDPLLQTLLGVLDVIGKSERKVGVELAVELERHKVVDVGRDNNVLERKRLDRSGDRLRDPTEGALDQGVVNQRVGRLGKADPLPKTTTSLSESSSTRATLLFIFWEMSIKNPHKTPGMARTESDGSADALAQVMPPEE